MTTITTWPILATPPEISDEELFRLPQDKIRATAEHLLRQKRAPAVYHQLLEIGNMIAEKINALDGATDLDNHIVRKQSQQRWIQLGQTVVTQMDWHLRQVKVDKDEVFALVTRWLMLRYGDVLNPARDELKGVRI